MSKLRSTQQTRFNVSVTEADIERATRNDSYVCVVAQAIARTIPEAHHIEVDIQTIRFTLGNERYAYLTPYSVQGYIVGFDAGDAIHPFTFQLRDPKRLRRRVHTEAGKAIKRAESRATRRREIPSAKGISQDTDPEVESVREAYEGQQKRTTVGGERIPPRVHKRKARTYGQRLLRINRDATSGGASS